MQELKYVDMARKCVEQTKNFRFNLPAPKILTIDGNKIGTDGWMETHSDWSTIVNVYHEAKELTWQMGPVKRSFSKYKDRNNLTYTMLIEESDAIVYDQFEFSQVITDAEKSQLGAHNIMVLNMFISHPQYAERRSITSWHATEMAIEEYEKLYPRRAALIDMREVAGIKWKHPIAKEEQDNFSREEQKTNRKTAKEEQTRKKKKLKGILRIQA